MPDPTPGLHLAVSRTRLGQMNDQRRNGVLIRMLEKAIHENGAKNILCLGELSLLPLMAAKLGAQKVAAVEKNAQMRAALEKLAADNEVRDKLVLLEEELESVRLPFDIDAVVAEPNFALSMLPWDNLRYWFCLDQLRQSNKSIKTFFPAGAEIWALPVEFLDLWKIRSPVGETEGFSIAPFDDIIMSACDDSDAEVEPHPLWEYPCIARGRPEKLMQFNFADSVPKKEIKSSTKLSVNGKVNGVALWMVWDFGDDDTLSSGPTESVKVGSVIEWDVHSKQGVHIFVPSKPGQFKNCASVSVETRFDPVEADMDFAFKLLN